MALTSQGVGARALTLTITTITTRTTTTTTKGATSVTSTISTASLSIHRGHSEGLERGRSDEGILRGTTQAHEWQLSGGQVLEGGN